MIPVLILSSQIRKATALVALAVMLVTAGCGGADETESNVTIVATTTILGDIAQNIVGDDAVVEVLIPLGTDPHDYQASSRQIALMQSATLVVANGLNLEEGLLGVLETAAEDGANVISVGELLDPIPFDTGLGHDDHGTDDDHETDDDHDTDDPHFWLDPQRVAQAGLIIADELEAIDNSADWTGNAEVYASRMLETDNNIIDLLSAIAPADRKLVTNHGAFGYFAARYDFEIIGTVIPGGSTIADPSSSELADLVQLVTDEDVPAIFASTSEPAALAEAVAAEVGEDVQVVDLYTGSLGEPGSGAETLIGMLETNAKLIAEAMS